MIYQKMPTESVYKMETITCSSSAARDLLDLWQSRIDSGEWPLSADKEAKKPKGGWLTMK